MCLMCKEYKVHSVVIDTLGEVWNLDDLQNLKEDAVFLYSLSDHHHLQPSFQNGDTRSDDESSWILNHGS